MICILYIYILGQFLTFPHVLKPVFIPAPSGRSSPNPFNTSLKELLANNESGSTMNY